ncbi:MAG: DUF1902 domain-containing protein [Pseudomonadota bacterium]
MTNRFYVQPIWDAEAEVWITESNIEGLHLEAKSLPEFNDLVQEFAGELILANHMSDAEITRDTIGTSIPTVVIQQPGSL